MNDMPRTDGDVRRELARDARDVINDRAIKAACALMRTQWYQELLDPKTDVNAVYELRAKLQVVEMFPQMLQKMLNDEMMAQKTRHGRSY